MTVKILEATREDDGTWQCIVKFDRGDGAALVNVKAPSRLANEYEVQEFIESKESKLWAKVDREKAQAQEEAKDNLFILVEPGRIQAAVLEMANKLRAQAGLRPQTMGEMIADIRLNL